MKKFKLLFAVVAVIAILSTAVFAAEGTLFDIVDATAVLNDGSVSLRVESVEDVTVYNGGGIKFTYDASVWEYVTYENGKTTQVDPTQAASGLIWLSFDPNNATPINKGDVIGTLTMKLKDGKTVADDASGITLSTDDYVLMDSGFAPLYPNDTVFVTGGAPVGPVSVATTMTVNGKEYTDIPNATVENVAFTDGVITGALNIDYWKNGAAQPAIVIEAAKFVGMPANVTGTGTASFTVALMGVPENVVVTGISFK